MLQLLLRKEEIRVHIICQNRICFALVYSIWRKSSKKNKILNLKLWKKLKMSLGHEKSWEKVLLYCLQHCFGLSFSENSYYAQNRVNGSFEGLRSTLLKFS